MFPYSSSSSTSSSRSTITTGALSKYLPRTFHQLYYLLFDTLRPNVKFFCDLDYDPFLVMQDGNKVYGFTVSLYEYPATIPTLWDATKGDCGTQFPPKVTDVYLLSLIRVH